MDYWACSNDEYDRDGGGERAKIQREIKTWTASREDSIILDSGLLGS